MKKKLLLISIPLLTAIIALSVVSHDARSDGQFGQQGDITAVNAGSGITGGCQSGPCTVAVNTTYVQRRISTACGAGSAVQSVDSAGNPTCVAAGGGLSGLTTNTIQKATSGTAIGNSLLTDNATTLSYNAGKFTVDSAAGNGTFAGTLNSTGNLTEATVRVVTVAGTGLSKSGGTLTLNMTAQSCSAGQHLATASSVGVFTCTADTNSVATGTTDTMAKYTSTTAIGNSLLTDNATTLSYNAGKFTVDSAAGNGAFAGTLNSVGNLSENSVRVVSAAGTGLSKSGGTLTLNMTAATCSAGSAIRTTTATGGMTCGAVGTVTGTGTTNTIPKFTGASALGDSGITDDGTTVAITNSRVTTAGQLQLSGSTATTLGVDLPTTGITNTFTQIVNVTSAFATYNTTAANLSTKALQVQNFPSASTGANQLNIYGATIAANASTSTLNGSVWGVQVNTVNGGSASQVAHGVESNVTGGAGVGAGNYAFWAKATGATNNFSFYGNNGVLNNQDAITENGNRVFSVASAPLSASGSAVTLALCSSNQIVQMNAGGTAWACVAAPSGGGITNSAANNVVTKSNGTNIVASAATDNGTTFAIGEATTVTGTLGVSGALTENTRRVFSAVGTGLAIDGTNAYQVDLNMAGGTCGAGSGATALSATGVITCGADVTSVAAGTGISAATVSGAATVTLNMTAQSCSAGSHISAATAVGVFTCTTDASGGPGTGTAGLAARWATSTTLGNSAFSDNGTQVGLGTAATSTYLLDATKVTTSGGTVFHITNTVGSSSLDNVLLDLQLGGGSASTNYAIKSNGRITIAGAMDALNYNVSGAAASAIPCTTVGNYPSWNGSSWVCTAAPGGSSSIQYIATTATGAINNFAPGITANQSAIFFNGTSFTEYTGLAAGTANGQQVKIYNNSGQDLQLDHASGSSSTGNKFALHASAVVLKANGGCSITLVYGLSVSAVNAWYETDYQCSTYSGNYAVSGTLTVGSNVSVTSGSITSSNFIQSNTGGLYANSGQTYINSNYFGCEFGTASTATCYFNRVGAGEATTQFRNFELDDGEGSGAAHNLFVATGSNGAISIGTKTSAAGGVVLGSSTNAVVSVGAFTVNNASTTLCGTCSQLTTFGTAVSIQAGTTASTIAIGTLNTGGITIGASGNVTNIGGSMQVASSVSTGGGVMAMNASLATKATGGTPTVTGCGTTPGTPIGTHAAGHVTTGTGATACILTWTGSQIFASATPTCIVEVTGSTSKTYQLTAPTNAVLTWTSGAASTRYDWICYDHF